MLTTDSVVDEFNLDLDKRVLRVNLNDEGCYCYETEICALLLVSIS